MFTLSKDDIAKSANKIKKDIFLYPAILVIAILFSLTLIIYNSIEEFKENHTKELSSKLIEKEKEYSKTQLLQITNRIEYVQKSTELQLQNNLKNRIYEAADIIENIIKENQGKTKEELKKLVSIALAPMRFFKGRGYYLVYDKDTKKSVIHPVKRFVGKDMTQFKDKKGQLLVKLYDETVKQTGEGFANIYFVKPNTKDNKEYRKVVFVKSIPELNWVIGTGDYYDDVEKEVQNEVLERLDTLRYGTNGYIWIHDTNHTLLMHPFRKEAIGQNEKELQDLKGNYINKIMTQTALNNKEGAFFDYYWYKPNSTVAVKKVSFVKHIPGWDWIIGTGVYLDDIESLVQIEKDAYNKSVQNLYYQLFIVSLILLLAVTIFSYKLFNSIKNEFNFYSNTLENINEDLEEEVQKRTLELNELNNNLEKRVEEEIEKNRFQEMKLLEQAKFAQMGEMIGNIAHQWRQPLSVISTVASGLKIQIELDQFNAKDTIKNLDTLLKTSLHLSATIDHFRDFIKEKRELKEIIIQNRICEVLEILDASLTNNYIDIITDLHIDDPIKKEIVLGELSQVLINIINNSKDVLKDKEINNKWIKITCRRENNIAIISVEDNGGGISNDILPKIFDPYFTTKHQSQGTGIGLYMSKNIIEKNLKGKLYAENTENGAKFYIELPLNA